MAMNVTIAIGSAVAFGNECQIAIEHFTSSPYDHVLALTWMCQLSYTVCHQLSMINFLTVPVSWTVLI